MDLTAFASKNGAAVTDAAGVAAMLRERILSGELAPGERLQQIPLSEALGVSRTPLREALAGLARDGLLDYEPNRGYAVRAFGWPDIEQAYAVRARLEGFACHVCARRGIAQEAAERLWVCLRDGDAALAQLTPEAVSVHRAADAAFHETVLEAAGNRWLSEFVHRTGNVPLAPGLPFDREGAEVLRRSHDDHHRIARAILARDPERAEALMREHVTLAAEALERALHRRPG